ncbi:MAG: prolyl oligopeptidase family serine peptidase [Gammaproteobacteria bacterium]
MTTFKNKTILLFWLRRALYDSQVQYYEPAKYVPKLREYSTSGNPVFLSINLVGGHGGKSGRLESLNETALDYSFILNILNQQ